MAKKDREVRIRSFSGDKQDKIETVCRVKPEYVGQRVALTEG